MKGLFQCPPRASPWVITDANLSPCKGKSFKTPGKNIRLLPLQGALLIAIIPRAMPWARSFWAFSPFLNHMRKFSKAKVMRCFCRRKIRKANPEFCSHPLPRRHQTLPVLHPQSRYPLSSCGSSLRYFRSPVPPFS